MATPKYESIGVTLIFVGTILSIVGTVVNNVPLDHISAMRIWMISNPILLAWAIGKIKGYWDGGVSIAMLAVMYAVFTATNWYGLYVA